MAHRCAKSRQQTDRGTVAVLLAVVFVFVCDQGAKAQTAPTLPPNYEFVYPLPCDFEESYCQWVQMTDDNFDWTRTDTSTPTDSTGPSGDHTSGSGHYVFIETSSPRSKDEVARLISNYINPSQSDNCSMTFYYNMYGNSIGELNIYSKEDGSSNEDKRWSKQGAQGNAWHQGIVTFYNMQRPFQIIIEGVVGDGVRGDIAIDDTSFSGNCYAGVEGKVRLVSPSSTGETIEGRVEIYHGTNWGTICSFNGVWDADTDGKVVCRQLGYTDAESTTASYQADSSVPFHLDNVTCIGTEQNLTQCGHNGWGVIRSVCDHDFDDATVRCTDLAPPPCHPTEFTCSNEQCVWLSQLCDYTDDCGDGSDENPSLCDSYPGRCNFQDDLCNWIQLPTDDFDWTRHKGSTPTPSTGPTSDHNGNSDHYYMYMEVSNRPIYNITKLALAQPFQPTTDGTCKIRFYYHMDGNDIGYLKLQQLGMTTHTVTTIFEKTREVGNDWEYEQISLTSDESFQLYFEGQVGRSPDGDIAFDDVSFSVNCKLDNSTCELPSNEPVFNCTISGECISDEHTCDYHHNCLDGTDELAGMCNSRPGRCDFQYGFCTWSQSCFDQFDWTRNKGSTDTTFTGPNRDHTLNNVLGYYAYISAADQNIGDIADLTSISWSASDTLLCKIRFYYHMYGAGIGTLTVLVKDLVSGATETKWFETGNQGEEWQFASVDLSNSFDEFEVIIRASRGTDNDGRGDIAIDDLSFTKGCEARNDLLPPDLADGVRLVNGSGTHEGRLEVFYSGQWGTVCDSGFGMSDATVVCAHLGYDAAITYVGQAHFGRGSGKIWLTDMQCNGDETSLFDCSHSDWDDVGSCSHGDDVGVVCNTTGTSGHAMRLSGGRPGVPFEGRVEMIHAGKWGTICNTTFGRQEAAVICKQLHYDYVYEIKSFGAGTGEIHLGYLDCCGTEDFINECKHSAWGQHSCDHSQDAGVVCKSNDHPQEGHTRLANSNKDYEGRLEIYHDHEWGTICSDGWTVTNADVACRALLFHYPLIYQTSEFGQGTGSVHLSDVDCDGTEQSISECDSAGWGNSGCAVRQDVGIECSVTPPSLALATSSADNVGCLQLTNNEGKQVCLNGVPTTTLDVICKELGFEEADRIDTSTKCPPSAKQRVMIRATCSGSEDSLSECQNYGWTSASGSFCSDANNDPTLVCTPRPTTTPKPVTRPSTTVQSSPPPQSGVWRIEVTGERCNGGTYSIDGRHATVWSPNYPNSYPNSLDCQWLVTLTEGGSITFQFEALHIEANDELSLRDGPSVLSHPIAQYRGVHFPDSEATLGPNLHISFMSDALNSYTGFKIHLSKTGEPLPFVYTGPVVQQCSTFNDDEPLDASYDADDGEIYSPNYPLKYPSSLSCGWLIILEEGEKIEISLETLDIKDDDTLTIFDGNGQSEEKLLEYPQSLRRRRRSDELETVTTSDNVAVVKFVTNAVNEDDGFSMKYSVSAGNATPDPIEDPPDNGQLIGAIVGCVIAAILILVIILFIFGYRHYKKGRPIFGQERARRYEEQIDSGSVQNVNHPEPVYDVIPGEAPPPYSSTPNVNQPQQVIINGGSVAFNNRCSGVPSAPPPPPDVNGRVPQAPPMYQKTPLDDDAGYETPQPTNPSIYERPHAYDRLSGAYKYETMRPGVPLANANGDDDLKKKCEAFVNLPPDTRQAPGNVDKRLYQFLLDLELEHHAEKFAQEGIKYDDLLTMDLHVLRDIPMGDRKIIKKRIKKLRRETEHELQAGNHGNDNIPKEIKVQEKRVRNHNDVDYADARSSQTQLTPYHTDDRSVPRQPSIQVVKPVDGKHQRPQSHMYDEVKHVDYPIPDKYLCPITSKLMVHPRTATDGVTYEREAILDWFSRSPTSPVTRQQLFDFKLMPNTELEKEIQKFRKERKKSLKKRKKKEEERRFQEESERRPDTPLTDVEV